MINEVKKKPNRGNAMHSLLSLVNSKIGKSRTKINRDEVYCYHCNTIYHQTGTCNCKKNDSLTEQELSDQYAP